MGVRATPEAEGRMSELEPYQEPIQARDAEVSLIGAALSGYPNLDELLSMVEAGEFYHPMHGQIWLAIERVHRAGNQPDPVTVRFAMDKVEGFDPIRLLDMAQLCPIPAQAPYYAERVTTAAGMRALVEAGVKVNRVATVAGDLDQAREDARTIIDEATRGRSVTRARTIADILPAVIDTAERGQTSMLSTGWPDLDRHLGGLAPGRLVLFAARPGVGKSVAGVNLALHFAAHHQHAVLLASLEMPEHEVGQRMLAAWANVNLTNIANGEVDERSWGKIAEKSQALADLPLTIVDTPHQTVTDLRRVARDIQRTRDDLALIIVDYLQLVKPSVRTNNRAEAVTDISRGLKLLARETGACVVAMAQVNRDGAKNHDGRPRLTDLREGGIENDADQVVMMHQPNEDTPEIELNVEKNRHGPKGRTILQMQGHYSRLASVAWTPGDVAR